MLISFPTYFPSSNFYGGKYFIEEIPLLEAYQDATVNLEVLSSIGDSGRFGVLDEYGYFGILGTSVYFSDATRLRGLQDFAPILPS